MESVPPENVTSFWEIRRQFLLTLLCFFAIISNFSSAQEQSAELLTLDQVIQLAIQNNRTIQVAQFEVEKAQARKDALKTKRYPALSLKVLETRTLNDIEFQFEQGSLGTIQIPQPGLPPRTVPLPGVDRVITSEAQFNTFFLGTVNQPITQLYRIGLGVDLHQIQLEISQEKLTAQRQTIIQEVKKAYFNIMQVQSGLDAVTESLKFFHELDRTIEDYVEQQIVLKADSLEVKARLAKQEHTRLTLQNNLATLRELLNNYLGRDIRASFRVSEIPDTPSVSMSMEEAQQRAVDQRPELKEARLKIKAAEMDRRLKKSEYIPDLSFVLGQLGLTEIGLLPSNVSFIGFYFSWDPFDWGRKSKELAEKSHTINQANAMLREGENLVLMDVNVKLRKLQEAKELINVTTSEREAAREKLNVASNSYKEQRGLLKDLLEAEASVADKNNSHQQAILSYWTALAEFQKAIGEE